MENGGNKRPIEEKEDESKGESSPAIDISHSIMTCRNSIIPYIHPLFFSKIGVLLSRLTNIICHKNFSKRNRRVQPNPTDHFYAAAAPTLADGAGNGEQFREEFTEFNAYLWTFTRGNELNLWLLTFRVQMLLVIDRSKSVRAIYVLRIEE